MNSVCHRITVKEIPPSTPADAKRALEKDFKDGERNEKAVSQEDLMFLEKLEQTEDGHYKMPLSFKKTPQLPDNTKLAESRLYQLKRKLVRDEKYGKDYVTYKNDIIKRGDAKEPVELPDPELQPICHGTAPPEELNIQPSLKPENFTSATKPPPKPEKAALATKPPFKSENVAPAAKPSLVPEKAALGTKSSLKPESLSTIAQLPHFHQAYAPNYHFIMDNLDVCKSPPFLVLMIPVAPKNIEARNAIRKTWGREARVQGERVLTLFMLGQSGGHGADSQSLQQENNLHHDLIQSDFIDSYLNLTIKTMVIMHWLSTHCTNATFAMKIDSDMFLNIENLVGMLKRPGIPRVNYLTGMLMKNRPVVRSKSSKWYVPEEMYPELNYPTYCLGMGYIFSNDLPAKYVEVSKTIKPFNIEDAYIGMCMKKLGLDLTAPPRPWQFKAYNNKYDRCNFSRVITYILGSSQQLLQYWADLNKPGPPC
ncbi:beta-1,3-galactosyltransferase 1-like [Eucyclogobius newberryi]|uniref:beta-1,3-galactosyltransferase 1-like n=1 Tax=Eucyclogobius newberryi TaxID=166745 RepID=UPI003B59530B